MSAVIEVRKKNQAQFVEKHGIKLGFMSFFIKASALALKQFPMVNSMIDGEEILTPQYVDVSIAVQTPKGLLVPVIRNAESLTLAQIETELKALAEKARSGRLSLDEMKGGTFTVTNGGVFGSMLSTPLINPPQSAILGMHNIVERPVAVNGNVEVRPVMYVALSYDHRIIDGKDSVGFLVKVKEMLEDPVKLLFSGNDPLKTVLDL
jgi:2-oxoglutarate dehydrogenase E2 component (dihydrolipoamide succinyltransferase)